ncbi:MAG: sulfocyanin-like copper-binding protein, partial [Rhodothermales bacterium]
PEGYTVTLTFKNNDPVMAHSIGVAMPMAAYPPMFDNPQPVFAGAISSNPTDMTGATLPGKSEVLTFQADKAGDYVLVCYIPAHATTGMWVHFKVSADGKAGLITG